MGKISSYARSALSAEAIVGERWALPPALRWAFLIVWGVYLFYFAVFSIGLIGVPSVGEGPSAESMERMWPEMPRYVGFALRIQNRVITDWADLGLYAAGAAVLAAALVSGLQRLYWLSGILVGVALLYALADCISSVVLDIHNEELLGAEVRYAVETALEGTGAYFHNKELLDADVRHMLETAQGGPGVHFVRWTFVGLLVDLCVKYAPHLLLAAALVAWIMCRVGRITRISGIIDAIPPSD